MASRCTSFLADMERANAPRQVFETTKQLGLKVNALVNNVVVSAPHLIGTPDWADIRSYLDCTMVSTAQMCHLFLPPMMRRGYGRIINLSPTNTSGRKGSDCNQIPVRDYIMSLSRQMNESLSERGINALAFSPELTSNEAYLTEIISDCLAASDKGEAYFGGKSRRLINTLNQNIFPPPRCGAVRLAVATVLFVGNAAFAACPDDVRDAVTQLVDQGVIAEENGAQAREYLQDTLCVANADVAKAGGEDGDGVNDAEDEGETTTIFGIEIKNEEKDSAGVERLRKKR